MHFAQKLGGTSIRYISVDRSKAIPLLQFFFYEMSTIATVPFVMQLFEIYVFLFWLLGKAVLADWHHWVISKAGKINRIID